MAGKSSGRSVFTGGQVTSGNAKTPSGSAASRMAQSTGFNSGRGQNGGTSALQATTGYRTAGSSSSLPDKLVQSSGAQQPAPQTATPGAPQTGQAAIDTAKRNQKALNGG